MNWRSVPRPVGAFAFWLVVLETLMGLPVRDSKGKDGRSNLMIWLEDLIESAQALNLHTRGWGPHHAEHHVAALFSIIERCFESRRRRRRTEVSELVQNQERMCEATEVMQPEVPPEFVCQISQEIMQDLVTSADGHSYERAKIQVERWLADHDTSPATNVELPHKHLV